MAAEALVVELVQTGWATPDQLSGHLDLPKSVKTLNLSMIASLDIVYVVRDAAVDHLGLIAPARIIGVRAQREAELAIEQGETLRRRHLNDATSDRDQSTDPAARASQAWTDIHFHDLRHTGNNLAAASGAAPAS